MPRFVHDCADREPEEHQDHSAQGATRLLGVNSLGQAAYRDFNEFLTWEALGTKADKVDAVLEGQPTAPTPNTADKSDRLATTAFTKDAIASITPVERATAEEVAEGVLNDKYVTPEALKPNLPFGSKAEIAAANIPAAIKCVQTQFFAPHYAIPATLVGGACYRRVNLEPSVPAAAKIRSLDRWTAEDVSDEINGGWWEIYEVSADFTQFGAGSDNTAAQNRAALQAGLDWAHEKYLERGSRVRVCLPDGTFQWGSGEHDATADWRHICHVFDGVVVTGPGKLVSNTPFATRSVGFVVRGDNVLFEGLEFEDTYSTASPWIIPIGAGTAYDSGLESGRTYRDLRVEGCTMRNAWLSASVQFLASDDGTITWDGFTVCRSISLAKAGAASGGNFNARAEPPGKIRNVVMHDNVAKDGKTASSYNLVGVHGFRVVNNESHRNLYAGCEIENGCERGIVMALASHDENIGLWIDDSRQIAWRGIAMHTTSETLLTPLLGTHYRSRPAVRISHQGFVGSPDYVTTDIVGGDVVGAFNRIEIAGFGTALGASRIETVIIDGYVFNGDGSTRTGGNTGIFSSNVGDLTICNARVVGALSTALNIGIPTGGVARLRNVVTRKLASETTNGLITSGSGRLVMDDCDLHSVDLAHTGGTEASKYRIAGVKQPDQNYVAQVTIPDDAAAAIDLPLNKNGGVVFVEKVGTLSSCGWVRVVWSGIAAGAAALATNGSAFAVNGTAGTLGGTTGTDGNLTVRANIDGKLYVENRTGSSGLFRIHWES